MLHVEVGAHLGAGEQQAPVEFVGPLETGAGKQPRVLPLQRLAPRIAENPAGMGRRHRPPGRPGLQGPCGRVRRRLGRREDPLRPRQLRPAQPHRAHAAAQGHRVHDPGWQAGLQETDGPHPEPRLGFDAHPAPTALVEPLHGRSHHRLYRVADQRPGNHGHHQVAGAGCASSRGRGS